MKGVLTILFYLLVISRGLTQDEKFWVFFTDKEGMEFNPYDYFDDKAIERRESLGLSLYDITDYPVNPNYINGVEKCVSCISHHTRWFNAVSVKASPAEIEKVKSLSYVKGVMLFSKNPMRITDEYFEEQSDKSDSLIKYQTERMGRREFQKANIDGTGIRIAVLDAGFTDSDINPCFNHLREGNKIIATYDFVKNNLDVCHGHYHGTAVLSCIAGIYEAEGRSDTLGLATGAEFLLARTEKAQIEVFSEEENWLAAVEWSDRNGADIINSSLGYTGNRYFYRDMNGLNTLVSRAGNLAAKKGILVVNSAGNDGSGGWNFVGAPADADSVMAVGGLLPSSGIHTAFSSVGPTYDFRQKPNVTAYGHVIAAKKDNVSETQGTSFSSPLTAGFAACAWQANRSWTNMELFHELEKGSDLYPYCDYAHGYGVPQASYFLDKAEEVSPTITLEKFESEIKVTIMSPSLTIREDQTQVEMPLNSSVNCVSDYEDYLFYQFQTEDGIIMSYKVIDLQGAESYSFTYPSKAEKAVVYYEGYTIEMRLK